MTFYALLAAVSRDRGPRLLYGLFADAGTINEHSHSCQACCPAARSTSSASRSSASPPRAAARSGFAFFSGLLLSLWSANAGMKAIFDALNIVYEEEEKRSFIRLNSAR